MIVLMHEYQHVILYVAPFVTMSMSLYTAQCIKGLFFAQIIGKNRLCYGVTIPNLYSVLTA